MITNSVTFYGFFAKMAFIQESICSFFKIGIYWKNLICFHYAGKNTTAAVSYVKKKKLSRYLTYAENCKRFKKNNT